MEKIDIEKLKELGPFSSMMMLAEKINEIVVALEGRAVVNLMAEVYRLFKADTHEDDHKNLEVFFTWIEKNKDRLNEIVK